MVRWGDVSGFEEIRFSFCIEQRRMNRRRAGRTVRRSILEWLPCRKRLGVGAVALMAELIAVLIRFQFVTVCSSTVSSDSSLLGIVEIATGNAWR